ncbi:hypothetical protein, partial [Turicimonas muris]
KISDTPRITGVQVFSAPVIECLPARIFLTKIQKNHLPSPVFPANGERLSFAAFLRMTIVLNLGYPFG